MSENRIEMIRSALERALSPEHVEIVDESHLHAGHAGARRVAGVAHTGQLHRERGQAGARGGQ